LHPARSIKILLTAVVAAMAMSAILASVAAAEVVPAKFSSSEFNLTTSGLTLKRNGIEAKTCVSPSAIEGYAESSNFLASNLEGFAETKFTCGGTSTFTIVLKGTAKYDTVTNSYSLHVNDFNSWSLWSPWSEGYWQNTGGKGSTATWTNGSGSTASTVKFTNQWIGSTFSGKQVTIEGTLKATTLSGGLLTLSH
jgi:hypothetical protein